MQAGAHQCTSEHISALQCTSVAYQCTSEAQSEDRQKHISAQQLRAENCVFSIKMHFGVHQKSSEGARSRQKSSEGIQKCSRSLQRRSRGRQKSSIFCH